MGLDDLARKAKDAWQNEKVQDALRSEKAEGVSDSVLDRAADAAERVTGGRYTDKVSGARDAVDARIGTDQGPDADVQDPPSSVGRGGPAGSSPARQGAETEPPSTPDPSTPEPEPERNPTAPDQPPGPQTPGAPTDPTTPPTAPRTTPPTTPGPVGER